MTQLTKVNVGEIIKQKIIVELNVASNLYLIFPVYVSFGTWNKAVNHLPIAVNGMKFEIKIDKVNAITKLVAKFAQSIVVKLIVKIPPSRSDWATIADDKHKKNETGMPQITLQMNVANLNLGVITSYDYSKFIL